MTQVIKKINDNLDFNYLDNSQLSIQINLDGFSFCILNNDLKEITALYSYEYFDKNAGFDKILNNIEQIVNEEPLLQKKYQSVNLTFKNSLNTFVPTELFDKEIASSYLQHNIKILQNDLVAFDELKSFELVNVYVPYVNIINYFFELYGTFEYQHTSTVLVKKLLEINVEEEEKTVYINVANNDFEIVVLQQQNLLFYNSFNLKSTEDFAYFTLFTFEQLNLDRDLIKIVLIGDIDENHNTYKLIYKYIRNIEFLKYPYPYKFDILLNIPNHQNFVILNQF